MKRLIYSPDAIEKLREIDLYLKMMYGDETASEIKKAINARIKSLKTAELQGVSVRDLYGFNTNYRRIFTNHYHIFYRVDAETIFIVAIFHEREDFISRLFGE